MSSATWRRSSCSRIAIAVAWNSCHETDCVVLRTRLIDEAMSVRRASLSWLLVVIAVTAAAVFVALTIAVTGSSSLAFDSRAFEIAGDLRAPWLDAAARVVTKLGLIAIVGPAVLVGAAVLIKLKTAPARPRVLVGAALAWISVRIVKSVVDRPRPPDPLVHTSGQSYPSAHAANSVGWLALAIALTVVIPTRSGRIAAIAGALSCRARRPEPDLSARPLRLRRPRRRSSRRCHIRTHNDRRARLAILAALAVKQHEPRGPIRAGPTQMIRVHLGPWTEIAPR